MKNININDMLYYINNDKKGNKIIGIKDIGLPVIKYYDNDIIKNILLNDLTLNYNKSCVNNINSEYYT